MPASRVSLASFTSASEPAARFTSDPGCRRWLASRSSLDVGERRLVAREGLEPSKPLGRQIYSLLRLTASLPRQLAVFVETRCFGLYSNGPDVRALQPMELAKGFEPPTC